MVDPARFAAFVVVVVTLTAIPGPSVLFVVSRGVVLGRRAAVLTAVGNELGLMVQVVAAAFGLGAAMAASQTVFTAVKLIGAVYLVYLGVQAWRHRNEMADGLGGATEVRRTRRVLREGVIVGVTNPKGLLIFTAVVPQFLDHGRGNLPMQLLVLGTVCVLIGLISDSVWGLLAGTARVWLGRSPRRLEVLGGAGGAIMVGLGVQMAISGTVSERS